MTLSEILTETHVNGDITSLTLTLTQLLDMLSAAQQEQMLHRSDRYESPAELKKAQQYQKRVDQLESQIHALRSANVND